MDEILEGWDKDLYDKLSFDFLIECAENEKIDEWNELYLEYLDSEWTRLYPEREWYSKNVVELVGRVDISDLGLIEYFELQKSGALFKRPDFSGKDFKEAISRRVCFYDAHLEGANFRGAHLQGATFNMAHLEMADFNWAHLEGADFNWAHLKGATFKESHLERAKFSGAYLEEATFKESHLERTIFSKAHLEGTEFIYSIVNGETMFTGNIINKNTDFTGTGLSATRIDPNLRTRLERNIREIHWEKWYEKPKSYPYFANIPQILWGIGCRIRHLLKDPPVSSPKKRYDPKDYPPLKHSTFYRKLKKVLSWTNKSSVTTNSYERYLEEIKNKKNNWETKSSWIDKVINGFVRLFWWVSNYGSSTKRVIGVFFAWNIFWAFIYQFVLPLQSVPILAGTNTMVLDTPNIITAVMQTNLMMFSITDVATRNLDYPALIFVTVQIVIGYFILAALITRLGIMFQNLSP